MSQTNKKDTMGMAYLDPQLVHRILLTDPSQFPTLTVSGRSQSDKTPTFDEFCKELSPSSIQSLENTMKRAYRDRISDMVYTSSDIKPLQELLLELHRAVRSLVPNRPDLHSMLKDEEIRKTKFPKQLLPYVVAAGDALSRLESEIRYESTRQWLQKAQSDNTRTLDLKQSIEFLVTSIFYLMFKAETCQQEKQDFFLGHVLAPRIHSQGPDLERQVFEAKYGKLQEKETAPLTKQWISELVSQKNKKELCDSVSAREALVKQGWINNILFREPERTSMSMPEILAMDFEQLNSIRLATRSAAAGSALALHACNAAGVGACVLNEQMDVSSPIYLCRQSIAGAMVGQHNFTSNEAYEESVGKAVVRLAKEWNPSLSSDAEARLKNQTTSVLRAEDPVIRLLDGRMKEVFSSIMTWKPSSASVEMQSGRAQGSPSRSTDTSARAFLMAAKSAFCQRGLSFYASDLANVSYVAKKVADLAWKVYGEPLLDKIILEAIQELAINNNP